MNQSAMAEHIKYNMTPPVMSCLASPSKYRDVKAYNIPTVSWLWYRVDDDTVDDDVESSDGYMLIVLIYTFEDMNGFLWWHSIIDEFLATWFSYGHIV